MAGTEDLLQWEVLDVRHLPDPLFHTWIGPGLLHQHVLTTAPRATGEPHADSSTSIAVQRSSPVSEFVFGATMTRRASSSRREQYVIESRRQKPRSLEQVDRSAPAHAGKTTAPSPRKVASAWARLLVRRRQDLHPQLLGGPAICFDVRCRTVRWHQHIHVTGGRIGGRQPRRNRPRGMTIGSGLGSSES